MNETNQRVILTKRLLKDALLRLLKKKPLDKINITELCREAGINRATFYRHYALPRDVLTEIQEDFFKEMLQALNTPLLEADVERCYAYLYAHADLIKFFIQYDFDSELPRLFGMLYQNVIQTEILPIQDTQSGQLLHAFLAGGGYFLLRQWLLEDIQKTPKEIADLTLSIINKNALFKNSL